MVKNIEIKAALRNPEEAHKVAKELSGNDAQVIPQKDIFYKSPQGRLKLRCYEDGKALLCYYERPDQEGPKLSDVSLVEIATKKDCDELADILAKVNGILGVVEKVRHLYLIGQSKIHVDKVNGLGDFFEIEVVLQDHQTLEEGEVICNDLLKKFGIEKCDLISNAYFDLLQQNKSKKD